MPKPFEIIAEVKGGHLPEPVRRQIAATLQLFDGGMVSVKISRPRRTTESNRYYWGVVIAAIQSELVVVGRPASSEAVHIYFRDKYLPARAETVGGREVVLPPTTTELDQTAFSDYIEHIKHDELTLALDVWIEDPPDDLRSYRIAS